MEIEQQVFEKLRVLRWKHEANEIDLFALLKCLDSKKMQLKDFLGYLKQNGTEFSQEEYNYFQKMIPMNVKQEVYIKDFLKLLGIKKNKEKKNDLDKKDKLKPKQQVIKSKERYSVQYPLQSLQELDMMKSSIQTNRMYELLEENLPGFQQFETKFQNLRLRNQKYNDSVFKPCPKSLQLELLIVKKQWDKLEWKRPEEFVVGKYQMFTKIQSMFTSRIGLGKLISPYDIAQGVLGDCYFLSAISSLAIFPDRILNLFITRIINPYGIYCVKICHDGEWKAVIVDDQIPCLNNKPAFTKSNQHEIWVLILEKAWAKLFGSYGKIESGFCREALRDLTGAPTRTVFTQDNELFNSKGDKILNTNFQKILKEALSNENNNFVLNAGAESSDILPKAQADRLGLVNSHAYSIIGMKEIIHPKYGKITLVKLRNPWGRLEWKGKWSDSCPLWTPELINQLRIKQSDDGIFYMSIEDFQKFFSDVTICYFHNNYKYESYKINSSDKKHSKYFTVKIDVEGHYYFSIIQPNKRSCSDYENHKYSPSRLFISQIYDSSGQQVIKYIGGIQKKDREIFVEANFQKGEYLLQCKVFLEFKGIQSFVISSYGVSSVKINSLKNKHLYIPEILQACFLQEAKLNPKMKSFTNENQIKKVVDIDIQSGYGYYYINNLAKLTLHLTINFNSTKGVKPIKPYKFPIIECIIKPKSELILPLVVDWKGYSYKSRESYFLK